MELQERKIFQNDFEKQYLRYMSTIFLSIFPFRDVKQMEENLPSIRNSKQIEMIKIHLFNYSNYLLFRPSEFNVMNRGIVINCFDRSKPTFNCWS